MSRYDDLMDMIADPGDDCIVWPYSANGQGYGEIRIDYKKKYTHRLALETVSAPPTPKHHAAHGPCHNPSCVNPNHLSWKSASENAQDKKRDGTNNDGENHGASVLTDPEVREIRRLWATGDYLQRELADRFGPSQGQVSEIVNQKTWKHLATAANV